MILSIPWSVNARSRTLSLLSGKEPISFTISASADFSNDRSPSANTRSSSAAGARLHRRQHPHRPVIRLLLTNTTIIGVAWEGLMPVPGVSLPLQWARLSEHVARGAVFPVSQVATIDHAPEAIATLDERRASGKIVLTVNETACSRPCSRAIDASTDITRCLQLAAGGHPTPSSESDAVSASGQMNLFPITDRDHSRVSNRVVIAAKCRLRYLGTSMRSGSMSHCN